MELFLLAEWQVEMILRRPIYSHTVQQISVFKNKTLDAEKHKQ